MQLTGDELRHRRARLGWTQREMARRLGVSKTALSNAENAPWIEGVVLRRCAELNWAELEPMIEPKPEAPPKNGKPAAPAELAEVIDPAEASAQLGLEGDAAWRRLVLVELRRQSRLLEQLAEVRHGDS